MPVDTARIPLTGIPAAGFHDEIDVCSRILEIVAEVIDQAQAVIGKCFGTMTFFTGVE